jgi:hypothetical protein
MSFASSCLAADLARRHHGVTRKQVVIPYVLLAGK